MTNFTVTLPTTTSSVEPSIRWNPYDHNVPSRRSTPGPRDDGNLLDSEDLIETLNLILLFSS